MRVTIAAMILLLLTGVAVAQVHGVPPSVTSLRPGQHVSSAPPPSVTSVGPFGWTPPFSGFRSKVGFTPNFGFRPDFRPHRHSRFGKGNGLGETIVVPFYAPYPAYPLFYPMGAAPDSAAGYDESGEVEVDPATAPTGAMYPSTSAASRREVAPVDRTAAVEAATPVSAPPPPVPAPEVAPQEPTVLVFRDGHQLQVQNYAIVGNQIYNFSDSGPRKILTSELDLAATRRVNDDRGVLFQLPVSH